VAGDEIQCGKPPASIHRAILAISSTRRRRSQPDVTLRSMKAAPMAIATSVIAAAMMLNNQGAAEARAGSF
jgi:hypothetical protein